MNTFGQILFFIAKYLMSGPLKHYFAFLEKVRWHAGNPPWPDSWEALVQFNKDKIAIGF